MANPPTHATNVALTTLSAPAPPVCCSGPLYDGDAGADAEGAADAVPGAVPLPPAPGPYGYGASPVGCAPAPEFTGTGITDTTFVTVVVLRRPMELPPWPWLGPLP
jgi:hypothetical protein